MFTIGWGAGDNSVALDKPIHIKSKCPTRSRTLQKVSDCIDVVFLFALLLLLKLNKIVIFKVDNCLKLSKIVVEGVQKTFGVWKTSARKKILVQNKGDKILIEPNFLDPKQIWVQQILY